MKCSLWVSLVVACSTNNASPMSDGAAVSDGDATSLDAAPDTVADSGVRSVNSPGTSALLDQMKQNDAKNYETSVSAGVKFLPTKDGMSFYAYWLPSDFDTTKNGFVVSLHGHGSFVSSDFVAWQNDLASRKYGFIALQWWFGRDQTPADYYLPSEIYPELQRELAEQKVVTGKLLLHGFSRGAAQTYALTAMDKASPSPLFRMTIANAAGVFSTYEPNAEVEAGKYGALPYTGTSWVLFCGGKDPEPDQSGCPAMEKSRTWIEKYGGKIELFINDPTASHGGFQTNSANSAKALDVYRSLTGF